MQKEFNVDFLGLNGAIDEEAVRAMFQGDGDITKLPSDFENISDTENAADIYKRVQRIVSRAWDDEMRNQSVKMFPSDFTRDHPPILLKTKNADIIAALTTELSLEINEILDIIFPVMMSGSTEIFDDMESQSADLFERLFIRYLKTVAFGIKDSVIQKAQEQNCPVENLSKKDWIEALENWADGIISQAMPIMTVGQKAKEISLITREIPQEEDFSAKQNNRSRTDAFRKLFHTRSKVTVLLMNDYIDDKNFREEAIRQASPDELASGNAYVDDFLKTLNETDCEITKLLLQKFTQQEIADKLGIINDIKTYQENPKPAFGFRP